MRASPFILLLLIGCTQPPLNKYAAPPSVSIENPADGTTVDEGVPVVLSGVVTDPYFEQQLDTLAPTWSVDGAKVCDGAVFDVNGRTSCDNVFSEGTSTITLQAINPEGQQGTASVTITVNQNNAPTAELLAPVATGSYYSNYPIEFLATATDTEDSPDALTLSFTSSLDGTLSIGGAPTSDGQFSAVTNLTEGSHYITMLVADSTGRTAQDSVQIDVKGANHVPECGILSPTSGANFDLGETVLFEATATDADISSSSLSAVFTSDKDGVIGTLTPSGNGSVQFGTSNLSSNTHTITLTVTDEVGETCTDAILVSIGNAPDMSITEPISGFVVNEGERVNFAGTVSDIEDTPSRIGVVWSSSIDGTLFTQNASSDGTVEFSTSTLSLGTHSIQASATDTDGLVGLDSITLYVNGLPGQPTIAINPNPATSGDNLRATVTVDAVDPEGDSLTYSYVWYQNGNLTTYTGNTVPASATTRGDLWEVQVTPYDGYGYGIVGSATINIDNAAPTVSSVTVSPTTAYTNTDLTATPSGWSDPDGDAEGYRYQWYLNSAALPGAVSAVLSNSYFVRGDQVYVDVTAWDGSSTGNTVSSALNVIQNSPPTAPGIAVVPERPEVDDQLECQVQTASTDADNDPITYTYAWTNNGSPTAFTTSTIPIGNTADGQTWVCTVTPSDGSATGTAGSDSVVVQDYTAPNAPVLSSISNYRNEDTVTVYGTTEPFMNVTLYIQGSSLTTSTTTANAAGSFSFSMTITRGITYSFYATATDANNNTSAVSNTLSTEACTPYDTYEDNTGYGDSGSDPVVDWSTLPDDGATSLSISGNIIDSADQDWYMIQTSDAATTGINYYRFRVQLSHGSGHYTFVVYDGNYSTAYLDCPSGSSSDPEGAGYTEYNAYQTDQGDAANHRVPSDTRACYNGHGDYNNCTDFSTTYWVKVIRTDGGLDCNYYTLTVNNGLW